jgi:hypothetical protein
VPGIFRDYSRKIPGTHAARIWNIATGLAAPTTDLEAAAGTRNLPRSNDLLH